MSPLAPGKSGPSGSILSQISEVKSQITQSQRLWLLTLAMGIAVLVIGILTIQGPWQEHRQQLASRYNEENERSELLLAIQRQKTELQGMESKFLLQGGATTLAAQVSQLARQSGLQIESVTPQPEMAIEPYLRFQIEITAISDLTSVLRFVQAVEDQKPLLWVEQMDMGEPPVEPLSLLGIPEEKTPFQMRKQQKVRFLIGAVSRQRGPA